MRVPINITNDITMGMAFHKAVPPPIPVPNISVELPANQKWTPGFLTNKNKLTTTVKHKAMSVVLKYHDCGPALLHLTLPVVINILYPLILLSSKRKISFVASTVKMNDKPVACAGITSGLPMMTCGEPLSLPTAFPLTSSFNTATVGMTTMDIVAGVAQIICLMAIDGVFHLHKVRAGGKNKAIASISDELTKKIKKAFLIEDTGKGLLKKVLGGLTDYGTNSLTADPTFKVGIGIPIWRIGFSGKKKGQAWTNKLSSHFWGFKADDKGIIAIQGEPL